MLLAVINKSTLISNADVQTAVGACASQNRLHLAPVWDMQPAAIIWYPSEDTAPPHSDLLLILDDSDQAGALGYHRLTPDDVPYSRVFVRPLINHGGTPLSGSLSVSADMSHEVCEWFVDRFLNLWADGPDGQYPLEICDPVQEDSYDLDGASVSNFVYKHYFDRFSRAGLKLDHLGKLTKPFSITDGGYIQVRKQGQVSTVFGARYPDWRKDVKAFPAARTYRREHEA